MCCFEQSFGDVVAETKYWKTVLNFGVKIQPQLQMLKRDFTIL